MPGLVSCNLTADLRQGKKIFFWRRTAEALNRRAKSIGRIENKASFDCPRTRSAYLQVARWLFLNLTPSEHFGVGYLDP